MLKLTEKFEHGINMALLAMLVLVVLLATIDLGWIILKDILTPPMFLLEVDELLELFGAFLLVMIGLDLLDTVKIYITKKTIHVEVEMISKYTCRDNWCRPFRALDFSAFSLGWHVCHRRCSLRRQRKVHDSL